MLSGLLQTNHARPLVFILLVVIEGFGDGSGWRLWLGASAGGQMWAGLKGHFNRKTKSPAAPYPIQQTLHLHSSAPQAGLSLTTATCEHASGKPGGIAYCSHTLYILDISFIRLVKHVNKTGSDHFVFPFLKKLSRPKHGRTGARICRCDQI